MSNVNTIIFDFFGVFAPDVYPDWLQSNVVNLEERKSYFFELALSMDKGTLSKDEFLQILSKETNKRPAAIEFELNNFELDQQLIKLLEQLASNYKIGLLCNASAKIIGPIITNNNLAKYFHSVVISSDVGLAKPQREIYELILKELKTSANHAIFIDDRQANVDAANSIGITGILYTDLPKLSDALNSLGIHSMI